MTTAAERANAKVLLQPMPSRAVVRSSNQVAVSDAEFHEGVGIGGSRQSSEARRWIDAAADARDRVIETGGDAVGAARLVRNKT